MKKKSMTIDFLRPSEMSDLTCRDGEIESFKRIPWLEANSSNPDSKNPSSTVNSKPASVEVPVASLLDSDDSFPPGSKLLAIHTPECATDVEMAIYITPQNTLGTRKLGQGNNSINIGFLPHELGSILSVECFGNLVTLVGNKGIAWLKYESATQSYSLLKKLPEAPNIEFSFDAAHLEGYTRMAGVIPEITVEVDLHEFEGCFDSDSLASWFAEGHGQRVDEAVRRCVYKNVAYSIRNYMAEVHDAGLFLTSVNVYAAFGKALPSDGSVVDSGYKPPYAKLLSWSVNSSTLTLRIAFSLSPMRLSATFKLSELQLAWREVFPELVVYTSSEIPWGAESLSEKSRELFVTGYTTLSDSEGQGFAFRFRSRSRSLLLAHSRIQCDYRKTISIDVRKVNSGVVEIPCFTSNAPVVMPCYTDFLPVQVDGGVTTDEGVLLWKDRYLLSPMKENGVVYRYRNRICDAHIVSVTQGGGSRHLSGVTRHPALVFCSDGVRKVNCDSRGGYENVQLVSREIMLDTVPSIGECLITPISDGVAFVTSAGLRLMNLSGKISIPVKDISFSYSDIKWIRFDYSSQFVIAVTGAGEFILYDVLGKSWHIIDDFPINQTIKPVFYNGYLNFISNNFRLSRLVINREVKTEVSTNPIPETSEETLKKLKPDDLYGQCYLLTRPLKLGNAFVRKRIYAIDTAVNVEFTIEGSDDLQNWYLLSQGVAPRHGLHLPKFRFHRLSIRADEEKSDQIHRLNLTIQ